MRRERCGARFVQEVVTQPCDLLAVLVSHGTAPGDANFLRLLSRARGRPAGADPVVWLIRALHC